MAVIAADVIWSEILNTEYENSMVYTEKFLDNVNSEIPQLLTDFLNHLLDDKKKKQILNRTL